MILFCVSTHISGRKAYSLSGQIVDATIDAACRQQNGEDGKNAIKDGLQCQQ